MKPRNILGLVLMAILALVIWALNDTLPAGHWFEPVGYYTRMTLGEVSNIFGMRRSMNGAVVVVEAYTALVAVYAILLTFWQFSPPPTPSLVLYRRAPLSRKIAFVAIYAVGAVVVGAFVWVVFIT